jgi:hypothetical protein
MAFPTVENSPKSYARAGGLSYLALILLGAFAEVVRNKIVVWGDPAATAAHLASAETLWRLGMLAEYVAVICVLALAMVYFVLFKPVSRELNLLVTFLRLMAIAVQTVAVLSLGSALSPLGHAPYLAAFSAAQLQAMTMLALKAHRQGYELALLFFGAGFLIHGRLIIRSGFLPKALGVLIQIAGACYASNSLALMLAPSFGARLFPTILLPCLVGEASLAIWLLAKGVDETKWKQMNARALAAA